jgi:hypothetical protein
MGAPQPVRTYTYNGVHRGTHVELWGGDTLQVDLVNHQPRLPHENHMPMTRPHAWTTTNLHTHGLHRALYGQREAQAEDHHASRRDSALAHPQCG